MHRALRPGANLYLVTNAIRDAGGHMFVVGVVRDLQWSAPQELDDASWTRLGEHLNEIAQLAGEYGLTLALHPHAGTLIETAVREGIAPREKLTLLGNGIDGVYRDVVKLSTTGTGALDAAWDPQASPVFAMALAGDDLYLGGSFPYQGTLNRRLAKVSASGTGAADAAWHPVLDGSVTALAVSGGDLYVGGAFTTINNAAHARIAKLPLGGSGAPDPAFTFSASDEVDAITVLASED